MIGLAELTVIVITISGMVLAIYRSLWRKDQHRRPHFALWGENEGDRY